MPTEEKIKLYEELHPEGKKFPSNKKPDEKPEDMEWLDKKLAEFGAFDKDEDEVENTESEAVEEPEENLEEDPIVESEEVKVPEVKVQTSTDKKVYTVAELLRMNYDHHAEVMREVEEGRAIVVK